MLQVLPGGAEVHNSWCLTRPRRSAAGAKAKRRPMNKKEQMEATGGTKGVRGRVIDLEVTGGPPSRRALPFAAAVHSFPCTADSPGLRVVTGAAVLPGADERDDAPGRRILRTARLSLGAVRPSGQRRPRQEGLHRVDRRRSALIRTCLCSVKVPGRVFAERPEC